MAIVFLIKEKKNKNNVKQYSMHLRDKVKVIKLCLTP